MPNGQDHIEAEWQFDVADFAGIEAWIRDLPASIQIAVTPADPEEHVDTYFDTDDWRIYRAGYALRLRRTQHLAELTLKALGDREAGLAERRELTQPLAEADLVAVDRIEGLVGDRVAALRGQHETRPLFVWITRRRRFDLRYENQNVGELALDHATLIGDAFEDQSQLLRVEIETSVDQIDHVRPFVDAMVAACCLRPATGSKFVTAAGMLRLNFPQAVEVGPVKVDQSSTMGELTFAVLRMHYLELLRHEPGTRLGDDPEELHDMRVAARRLRAALALFSGFVEPEFRTIRSEISWIASALGAVRDLDVQLDELHRWQTVLNADDAQALDVLREELGRRRETARERMLAALDSDRYAALVGRFGDMLRAGPGADRSEPALVVAPELVQRRYRKFQRRASRLGRCSADADFHVTRIDGKKLRYALEFVSPLYGKLVQQFIADLVRVQDLLGRHQDSIIAIDHLREIVRDASGTLPPETIFAMGRVAERYALAADESRRAFFKAYQRVRGKRWDRLERGFRRKAARRARHVERPSSPATHPAPQSGEGENEELELKP